MQLLLVRHGEALDEAVDIERSLSSKGIKDTEKVASFLKLKNLSFDILWYSQKKRAIQTAEIISKSILIRKIESRNDLNPNDPVDKFKDEILVIKKDIAIVGHLPFLSKLLSLLLTGKTEYEIFNFKPSSVVYLEYIVSWKVNFFIDPENIP